MVFSSPIFLFCFLPSVFLLSRLSSRKGWQNVLLALASLLFYAFGNPVYVPLFLFSVIINFLAGLLLGGRFPHNRPILVLSLILNLGLLAVFKYLDFFIENLSLLGFPLRPVGIVLPIGISFFTFQGLSYVIDVYRRPEEMTKSFGGLFPVQHPLRWAAEQENALRSAHSLRSHTPLCEEYFRRKRGFRRK